MLLHRGDFAEGWLPQEVAGEDDQAVYDALLAHRQANLRSQDREDGRGPAVSAWVLLLSRMRWPAGPGFARGHLPSRPRTAKACECPSPCSREYPTGYLDQRRADESTQHHPQRAHSQTELHYLSLPKLISYFCARPKVGVWTAQQPVLPDPTVHLCRRVAAHSSPDIGFLGLLSPRVGARFRGFPLSCLRVLLSMQI